MDDAYTEGVRQGRYIQDTNPGLPGQLQTSHARHCAIECGFIQQPEQEQYIQGYLAGYAKPPCPSSSPWAAPETLPGDAEREK